MESEVVGMEHMISEEKVEMMRGKTKQRHKIVSVLSMVSFPIYICVFYMAMIRDEGMSALFIVKLIAVSAVLSIGTFGLLWMTVVKRAYDTFNTAFKTKYVLQIIGQIAGFDKLQFIPKGGFLWDDVRNAAVVACGDKKYYESEDLLLGEYENVSFKISDVTTKKMVRRNKKNRVEEIFSGQIICLHKFDDVKKSTGHLQIFEKQFLSNMAGWKAEHEIHTENETFHSRFSVYASDEHNAYYILTPQRMETILNFADVVQGQVSLVFYDEKLFVAVRRESMFDANIDEPVMNQTAKIMEDANFIQKAKEILMA